MILSAMLRFGMRILLIVQIDRPPPGCLGYFVIIRERVFFASIDQKTCHMRIKEKLPDD